MKLRVLLLLLILSFSVGVAAAQNQSDWNKDERELTALVKKMTDAQINYDAAALDQIFAADYIEISPVGEFFDITLTTDVSPIFVLRSLEIL